MIRVESDGFYWDCTYRKRKAGLRALSLSIPGSNAKGRNYDKPPANRRTPRQGASPK